MSALACHGLTRRPHIFDWGLEIEAGEIVVLHGPSGSGKTLLLRTLADLDPSDSGEVRLDGRLREEIAPEAWRSSVINAHQSGVRLPGTVAENVAQVVAVAKPPGRVPDPPPPVPGLDPTADAEQLSGGEAQALALHRALLCEPDALLLDEATSAMDPDTAARWEGAVVAFAAAGHAVLWVAHDDRLAARVGARRERFP